MKSVLIETHYLPPLSYFSAIWDADQIFVEKHEHFVKQSYRNRCYINTSRGNGMLTIPVNFKNHKTPMCDVRIDYTQKWLNNHWRTLQSAYGKAPFFEHYAEGLNHILFKKIKFLFDLNYELLSLCLNWLHIKLSIQETVAYEKNPERMVVDFRNMINVKNPAGSNKYYKPVAYNQVFGNMFVSNLSLVDLIFCVGPLAYQTIQSSTCGIADNEQI